MNNLPRIYTFTVRIDRLCDAAGRRVRVDPSPSVATYDRPSPELRN